MKWLDSLEQSGDAHLGAALLRLSRQAVALHYAAALDDAQSARFPRAEESARPEPAVVPTGPVRKEVDR